jgi:hypothetical protein
MGPDAAGGQASSLASRLTLPLALRRVRPA